LLPRLLLLWGLSLSALPAFPEAARMAELPLRCSPSAVTRGGGTEDGAAKIFGSDLGFTARSFTWRVKPEKGYLEQKGTRHIQGMVIHTYIYMYIYIYIWIYIY
jgi:hypothetical protein